MASLSASSSFILYGSGTLAPFLTASRDHIRSSQLSKTATVSKSLIDHDELKNRSGFDSSCMSWNFAFRTTHAFRCLKSFISTPAQPAADTQPLYAYQPKRGRHRRCHIPMSNVCDGAFAANKIIRPGVLEVLIKYAVESACLILVPVHAILNLLRSISTSILSLR